MTDESPDGGSMPKARLESFSDGVIAIIATILVLEIHIPKLNGPDIDRELLQAVLAAVPLVCAYVVSFLVLLVFWVSHHHLIHSLRRVDRGLLWLNGLFLMVLVFVPVPAALIGQYPSAKLGSIIYGVVLAGAGLAFLLMRLYVSMRSSLLLHKPSRGAANKAVVRGLLSPVFYTIGAILAAYDTRASWAVYFAVPLIFILPGTFDRKRGVSPTS